MIRRRRKCCWLIALAAECVVGAFWLSAAEATDVYFPATTAYHRRNYDPFDQSIQDDAQAPPKQVAPSSQVIPASAAESDPVSDTQLSSKIRLLGSDPFEKIGSGSATASPSSRVKEAKFLAVPNDAPVTRGAEPLPMPPGTPPASTSGARSSAATQADGPDEPGARWSPKPLSELTTNTVLPGGILPRDYWNERTPQPVAFFDPGGATRGWPVNSFNWVASCLAHNPLYFEEINLERYGYGCSAYGPCCTNGLQSACSAAHFFATVPALPYLMAVDCPRDCDYTLGYYRPGSCPPWQRNCCTRCSALGGLSAGGAAVGLIFLIP